MFWQFLDDRRRQGEGGECKKYRDWLQFHCVCVLLVKVLDRRLRGKLSRLQWSQSALEVTWECRQDECGMSKEETAVIVRTLTSLICTITATAKKHYSSGVELI